MPREPNILGALAKPNAAVDYRVYLRDVYPRAGCRPAGLHPVCSGLFSDVPNKNTEIERETEENPTWCRRRPPVMSMSHARGRTRWSALAASALIQCCAGSSYCFGLYSPSLKASQGYDQSALDAVAFFKDVGANAGVLSGLLSAWAPAGRRRPWLVLLAGAALCAAGYLPMWLAVAGVAPAPLPLMCFYMLLAAQAQTFLNTADVVTAVENFPDRRGTVIGIMKVRCFPSFRTLFYCSVFPPLTWRAITFGIRACLYVD
jgi:hypothetical protein